ncbi:hypothetical protein HMPREF1020_01011 [Clostridium sp. 7_3_54FAA]|nr:hypothetical protein HMPREF1020_01011 [Clostridium sp. 7_3_54FAA]
MYFITTKRMLEVCFSAHPNIQYRTDIISFINYFFCTCTEQMFLPASGAVKQILITTLISFLKRGELDSDTK